MPIYSRLNAVIQRIRLFSYLTIFNWSNSMTKQSYITYSINFVMSTFGIAISCQQIQSEGLGMGHRIQSLIGRNLCLFGFQYKNKGSKHGRINVKLFLISFMVRSVSRAQHKMSSKYIKSPKKNHCTNSIMIL